MAGDCRSSVDFANAVSVTEISAAAGVGDDSAAGTTLAPFATFTHAMSVSASGDTVKLADGIYSEGETWPAYLPPTSTNIPDGVTIEGQSILGTILTPSTSALASSIALVMAGTTTIRTSQVHGFNIGLYAEKLGFFDLDKIRIHDNTLEGIYLAGVANVNLGSSMEIDSNAGIGIFAKESSVINAGGSVHDIRASAV